MSNSGGGLVREDKLYWHRCTVAAGVAMPTCRPYQQLPPEAVGQGEHHVRDNFQQANFPTPPELQSLSQTAQQHGTDACPDME